MTRGQVQQHLHPPALHQYLLGGPHRPLLRCALHGNLHWMSHLRRGLPCHLPVLHPYRGLRHSSGQFPRGRHLQPHHLSSVHLSRPQGHRL
jgi:hypothetical protein